MIRTSLLSILGLALVLTACRDLGLPGNVPEQEARLATPPELVVAVMTPDEAERVQLVADGRLWVPSGQPRPYPAGALRPVGATAGITIYARSWDERPYRALFTPVPMPAPDAAPTARAAMDAHLEHWQEYAPVSGRGAPAARAAPGAPAAPAPTAEPVAPAEPADDAPDATPAPATPQARDTLPTPDPS